MMRKWIPAKATPFAVSQGRIGAAVFAMIAMCAGGCTATDRVATGVSSREEVAPSGHKVIHVEGSPRSEPLTRGRLIGDKEGPNLLHNIGALLLDRENNLYVASIGTKRLMVYDSAGSYLRDVGRSGQGPAEYSEPSSLVWLADTLLVNDPDNGRVGKFTSSGNWLGSFPVRRANVPLYGLGDQAYGNIDFDNSSGALKRIYLVHRANGVADTLPFVDRRAIPINPSAAGVSIDCVSPDRVAIFSSTWRASAILNPAPDGTMLVATTDRFRIIFLNGKGDTARVIERALQAPRVSDEEWRAESERYDQFKRKVPATAACTQNSFPRIENKPMLHSVFFDSDGNLWVDANTSEGRFFEVFDQGGQFLRRVDPVARLESVLPFVRGNLMAVVETDSLDIQQIRLYRIGGGEGRH